MAKSEYSRPIGIEVEETEVFKNGNRKGTWSMRWSHQRWEGTWREMDEKITVAGDPLVETPISEEALIDLIYCTQE